jgi:hypothetical protein
MHNLFIFNKNIQIMHEGEYFTKLLSKRFTIFKKALRCEPYIFPSLQQTINQLSIEVFFHPMMQCINQSKFNQLKTNFSSKKKKSLFK